MIDPSALTGALFLAACLVVAGIVAVIGGIGWLLYWLWCHIDIVWIP